MLDLHTEVGYRSALRLLAASIVTTTVAVLYAWWFAVSLLAGAVTARAVAGATHTTPSMAVGVGVSSIVMAVAAWRWTPSWADIRDGYHTLATPPAHLLLVLEPGRWTRLPGTGWELLLHGQAPVTLLRTGTGWYGGWDLTPAEGRYTTRRAA